MEGYMYQNTNDDATYYTSSVIEEVVTIVFILLGVTAIIGALFGWMLI